MERDSLDGLIDDIDFDNLTAADLNSKEVKSAAPFDLNQLLDEVGDAFFDEDSPKNNNSRKQKSDEDTIFDDTNLVDFVQFGSKRDLESALYGVPVHIRKKWTDFFDENLKPSNSSHLGHSSAYSSWNSGSQSSYPSYSLEKSLRDLIMRASSKCELDAVAVNQIENELITQKETKKRYIEHLLRSKRELILSDENYQSSKYPDLAAVLSELGEREDRRGESRG
jgi:hypothetical protein